MGDNIAVKCVQDRKLSFLSVAGENDPGDTSGTTDNNFKYTGEQLDPNLGFYYLRARYLNPIAGGFFSMDSYGGNSSDPVSLNKYLYANAGPTFGVDLSGLMTLSEVSGYSVINAQSTFFTIAFGKGMNLGISDLRDPGFLFHLVNFKKYLDLSRNTNVSFGAETSVKINVPYSIIASEDEKYNNSVPGFISDITTEWSKTAFSPSGRRYRIEVNMHESSFWDRNYHQDDLIFMKKANCRFEGGKYNHEDHAFKGCPGSSPQASAHEFGHHLGFEHSYMYSENADGPFLYPGISGDVMGAGDGTSRHVQWYHIAILASIYGR